MRLLLEKGEIESRDSRGQTRLSRAAAKNHRAMVQLLLEKDAEIEYLQKRYRKTRNIIRDEPCMNVE